MLKRLFLYLSLLILFAHAIPAHQQTTHAADCATETEREGRRTRYTFDTTLNWSQRLLQVQQTVYYHNDHDEALTELMFHSEPHRLSRVNTMTFINAFDSDGEVLEGVTIDVMRITVPLAEPVESGCDAVIRLQYNINLHELSETNPLGWLGYTGHQINLALWFPTIAPYDFGGMEGWYTPTRHFIGEQSLTELSDFDMTIMVQNAPQGVILVAPGTVTQPKGDVWHIVFKGGRELGLTFSTIYVKTEAQVGDVTVDLYTLATTYRGAVTQAMNDIVQALELYQELYGPYIHDRLVVVEGDFPDGLEMSGMVFVSSDWFLGWNGTQVQWLTIITVHEVAHQWFYSQIMNDQSTYPYLDEALATYSELLYYEKYYPELVEDWWQFRIRQYNLGTDPVDSPVYGYTNWRPYINTVYFRGVMMLHEIREEIGDALFFKWLAEYYTEHNEGLVTPEDFWGSMSRFSYDSTADIRANYLMNPDVLDE